MFGLGKSPLDKGLDAFAQQNWKQARRWLEQSAEEHPGASGDYHLGLLYWRGLGGERDPRAGAACFQRAANEGHVAAQTAFGMALRSGIGVRKNIDEARKLFRSAAGGDDVDAMLELASLSEPEDQQRWLERAAEMGHAGAMHALSDILLQDQPIDALGWLYAGATLSNDEAARQRAAALAQEMSAAEIDDAQRAGRTHVKRLQRQARERR